MNSEKSEKKEFTIEDAKEILVSKMKKLSERDAGYRDLSGNGGKI